MSILIVPSLDERPWPSLGEQICDFIEQHLTFGPGDLLGQPAQVDDEKRALIHRAYQVYPKGHAEQGRRRFNRVGWSLRKGSAKTECAAWIAICELHPRAPVRTVGWSKRGQPIGGPVTDPFIPMVAYTEEQSEDLAYGAMRAILEQDECDIGQDFDVGLARILRLDGAGKAAAYASAPSARDGARTTFQHFDETHHMTAPRLKKAHRAMLANVPKRFIADAWSLETTTAYAPGEQSVAEDTHEYARAVADGRIRNAKLFFFHRQASDSHDLATQKGLRAAVREASGPAAWSARQVAGILKQFEDPTADRTYLERVWLNVPKKSADRAFNAERWAKLARRGYMPEKGVLIVLGFDGSKTDDATALIGTEILTGFQFPVGVKGIWERPYGPEGDGWEVPSAEVDEAVAFAYEQWSVWRLYADPPYWETLIDTWAGRYGIATEKKSGVVKWSTRLWRKMAEAVRAYAHAQRDGDVSHNGDSVFARHIANAHKRALDLRDEDNRPVWIIQKDRPGSPNKIDAAVAAVLSWRARLDALALDIRPEPSPYEGPNARGFLSL